MTRPLEQVDQDVIAHGVAIAELSGRIAKAEAKLEPKPAPPPTVTTKLAKTVTAGIVAAVKWAAPAIRDWAGVGALAGVLLMYLGCIPGPGPSPPAPGPAPPQPTPIKEVGLRVLISEETERRHELTEAQRSILTGKVVSDFVDANVVMGPDGKTREFRVLDLSKTTDAEVARMSKVWQQFIAEAKGQPPPYLVVSNGKTGYKGPLPKTPAEFVALVGKYKV